MKGLKLLKKQNEQEQAFNLMEGCCVQSFGYSQLRSGRVF